MRLSPRELVPASARVSPGSNPPQEGPRHTTRGTPPLASLAERIMTTASAYHVWTGKSNYLTTAARGLRDHAGLSADHHHHHHHRRAVHFHLAGDRSRRAA